MRSRAAEKNRAQGRSPRVAIGRESVRDARYRMGVGYDIIGVFFHPLHRDYGWGRTQLSLLATSLSISYGVSIPLIRWLLDRVDARGVVGFGTATVGVALPSASPRDSLPTRLRAYF